MITVIHEQRETGLAQARASGESLWVTAPDVERATGWAWKPEGLCRGETCIPLPRGAEPALVRDDRLDLAGLWRWLGNPVVHDRDATDWVLGTGAEQRFQGLAAAEAPDFALPDLAGVEHRLSDYRGRKVFLATWASW
ncbi:MAG: hypothetical protein RIS35_1289 [Pseudomonadota bacterium]